MKKQSTKRPSSIYLGCSGLILSIGVMWASLIPLGLLQIASDSGAINQNVAGALQMAGLFALMAYAFFFANKVIKARAEVMAAQLAEALFGDEANYEVENEGEYEADHLITDVPEIPEEKRGSRWVEIGVAIVVVIFVAFAVILRRQVTSDSTFNLIMASLCGVIVLVVGGAFAVTISRVRRKSKMEADELEALLQANNFPAAIRWIEAAIAKSPTSDYTSRLAELVYLRAGRPEEAEALLKERIEVLETMMLVSRSPRDYQTRLSAAQATLGLAHVMQHSPSEAKRVWARAVENHPKNELLFIYDAKTLLYQPTSSKVSRLVARAWAHAIEENQENALMLIEEARQLAASENNPAAAQEVFFVEGIVHYLFNNRPQAQRAFSDAVKADPNSLVGELATQYLDN